MWFNSIIRILNMMIIMVFVIGKLLINLFIIFIILVKKVFRNFYMLCICVLIFLLFLNCLIKGKLIKIMRFVKSEMILMI